MNIDEQRITVYPNDTTIIEQNKLDKLLKKYIPNVYDEMNNNDYNLFFEAKVNHIFDIKIEGINEPVGFVGIIYDAINEVVTITHVYILEKYRGKNIFGQTIKFLYGIFSRLCYMVSIMHPNYYIIKSLEKNNLAQKIDKEFYISQIPFTVKKRIIGEDKLCQLSFLYNEKLLGAVALDGNDAFIEDLSWTDAHLISEKDLENRKNLKKYPKKIRKLMRTKDYKNFQKNIFQTALNNLPSEVRELIEKEDLLQEYLK